VEKMIRIIISVLVALVLMSCGLMQSNPITYPTPIPNGPRDNALGGKQVDELYVWIYSNPNPPVQGENEFEAYICDGANQPVTDASLSFDLNMTNMNHGKNVVSAEVLGDGFYVGTVSFLMPGPWRAIVTIEHGGQTSAVKFEFNVK
jgi:hypothetical protein